MQNSFKKGTVVKLDQNAQENYIVVESMDKDNKEYILLTTCEGDMDLENKVMKNMKIDFSKLVMVCYDKENNTFSYDSNQEIISSLIKKLFLDRLNL